MNRILSLTLSEGKGTVEESLWKNKIIKLKYVIIPLYSIKRELLPFGKVGMGFFPKERELLWNL
jgi:hypothetical protein